MSSRCVFTVAIIVHEKIFFSARRSIVTDEATADHLNQHRNHLGMKKTIAELLKAQPEWHSRSKVAANANETERCI